jgi:hypothetical protein
MCPSISTTTSWSRLKPKDSNDNRWAAPDVVNLAGKEMEQEIESGIKKWRNDQKTFALYLERSHPDFEGAEKI